FCSFLQPVFLWLSQIGLSADGYIDDPDFIGSSGFHNPLYAADYIVYITVSFPIQHFPNEKFCPGSHAGIYSAGGFSVPGQDSGYMCAMSAVIPAFYTFFSKIPETGNPIFQVRVQGNSGIQNSGTNTVPQMFAVCSIFTPVMNGLFYPFHKIILFNLRIFFFSEIVRRGSDIQRGNCKKGQEKLEQKFRCC